MSVSVNGKLKVGVIGFGYWGPNIVRNFSMHAACEVVCIAEPNEDRRVVAQKACPTARIVKNHTALIEEQGIDAVAICTPVSTHYQMAKQCLLNGKHVLVEKPIATGLQEAKELLDLAQQRGLCLLVDYTFLYTGAVQHIRSLISNDELGSINYIDSTRINLGIYQSDVNVLWDLATHDLSVIYHLVPERPESVQAIASIHQESGIEHIAYLSLHYPSGMLVHLNCSWASPVKIRQMIIGGSKKMVIYDDIEPSDKLKVYEYSTSAPSDEERRKVLVDYRLGEVRIPKISLTEALSVMVDDFYGMINGQPPAYDAKMSLDIVNTLIKADESLQNGGTKVLL
ncbi:MAG: Gfo/Idh/MocA family oxidoreductase [Flavobacteriales bacterium]|nr:Gfo/Idh/MocA family oxidoreductase [Flavobacteriales bacterium]